MYQIWIPQKKTHYFNKNRTIHQAAIRYNNPGLHSTQYHCRSNPNVRASAMLLLHTVGN